MKEHKMKNKSCLYILTEFVSSLNISLHNKIEIVLRTVCYNTERPRSTRQFSLALIRSAGGTNQQQFLSSSVIILTKNSHL